MSLTATQVPDPPSSSSPPAKSMLRGTTASSPRTAPPVSWRRRSERPRSCSSIATGAPRPPSPT
jgi:hypothetical protein